MSTSPPPTKPTSLTENLWSLIHNPDGVLTRELLRNPGGFGLGQVPSGLTPDAVSRTVCGFCSTGCGLTVHLQDGEGVSLTPTTEFPVNLGMACPKGWEALRVLDAPDRATTPLLRDEQGRLEPVDWDTALRTFCDRMRGVQERHGAESIAFLSTGQIACEEMALLGSLFKFGMGGLHCDGNTRQCMATAATAYKESFGFDAPPYTYQDFEESDVLVFVGSNPCIAHPILWERVTRNSRSPEIVVIDPRRTETAMQSTRHLPATPKSDLVLFYGLAKLVIERGDVDQSFVEQHTTGFAEYAEFVRDYTLERVAEETGLDAEQIVALADLVGSSERVSFWWTMGVNQSHQGTRTAQAIINLALLTGNIGRPGTGANSITGQCNAMGSRLFSNTTNLLGGHKFSSEVDREKVAAALDIPVERIPDRLGWPYHQIIEGIERGEIKGLWVVATNPAHSWPGLRDLSATLDKLDFLVVQDMYTTTETAERCDLLLPAAGWGEKEGTFINSERRFSVLKRVRPAPGEALADFHVFRLIAEYWGCGDLFREWTDPEAVFRILQRCSEGQPCDITGIPGYAEIEACGGIQWPCTPEDFTVGAEPPVEQQRRLFTDGRFCHADGKARFIADEPSPLPEPTCDEFPVLLNTGRGSAAQWHTQTRTAKSPVLQKLYPSEVYVELNSHDARAWGISPQQAVRVESRRGSLVARAAITPTVPSGQVFIPMHYPETNRLTEPIFDPHSHQPAYKACAVRIAPVD